MGMGAEDRKAYAAAVEVCACFNFRRVSRSVTQAYDAALQPVGLRSTQFVTLAVVAAEEPVAMPALARALVMDRSTLTRGLKPLERDGFLKTGSARGSRGHVVRLTAKGRRKLEEAVPLWEAVQARFVQRFGRRRWREFLADLTSVVD